jgi:hypothetical protein
MDSSISLFSDSILVDSLLDAENDEEDDDEEVELFISCELS